jgi:signal transduction histidine kinase
MEQPPDLTLAGLAHDLNNVFQTLVEAADLLSEDPQWEGLSTLILRSVDRGKELTLSLQKAEQPPASLLSILEYAKSFVQDSLIGARGTNSSKDGMSKDGLSKDGSSTGSRGSDIRFVFDVDPALELPHARSWERVLVNLFSNAGHAMPHGGTIFVRARQTGASIEIVVSDDGPGIAEDLLPDVFKPHVSSRTNGGLGLHIVETIVRQERGEIRAANLARATTQIHPGQLHATQVHPGHIHPSQVHSVDGISFGNAPAGNRIGGAEFTIIIPAGPPYLHRRASA